MSALAFHEKAGRCQVILSLGKFISNVFLRSDKLGWLLAHCLARNLRVLKAFFLNLDLRNSRDRDVYLLDIAIC